MTIRTKVLETLCGYLEEWVDSSDLRILPSAPCAHFNMQYGVYQNENGDVMGDPLFVWCLRTKDISPHKVFEKHSAELFDLFREESGMSNEQLAAFLFPSAEVPEKDIPGIKASDAAHCLRMFIRKIRYDPNALPSWEWYRDEIGADELTSKRQPTLRDVAMVYGKV